MSQHFNSLIEQTLGNSTRLQQEKINKWQLARAIIPQYPNSCLLKQQTVGSSCQKPHGQKYVHNPNGTSKSWKEVFYTWRRHAYDGLRITTLAETLKVFDYGDLRRKKAVNQKHNRLFNKTKFTRQLQISSQDSSKRDASHISFPRVCGVVFRRNDWLVF